jgi:NhaA family Na+:H+ antiporter
MNRKNNRLTKKVFLQVFQPFQEFIRLESAAGLILLLCTVMALLVANSSVGHYYTSFWQTEISLSIDGVGLTKSLLHWINDGLMCIFFFVVGLEIKRELVIGELASFRRAIFPVAAAFGGMVVPAFIFILLNKDSSAISGWGIPMATDIAFSLGVLALLGSRIPHQLKVFLTAFAIVDDLGAVLIIAFFYGTQIQWFFVIAAACILIVLFFANWGGIQHPLPYLILGTVLWLAMLESGIHATVAGVLLAMTIPVQPKINTKDFHEIIQSLLSLFKEKEDGSEGEVLNQGQQSIVQTIELSCHEVETPLQRFEQRFHPWVTYFIMPLFAFANAGIVFQGTLTSVLVTPLALGIVFGLVIGKQIGITLFSWIAVKSKFAVLPAGVSWKHIYGISWLGGIGFTMSLFVANLAFTSEQMLNTSKVAIFIASLAAGIIGIIILRFIASSQSEKILSLESMDTHVNEKV